MSFSGHETVNIHRETRSRKSQAAVDAERKQRTDAMKQQRVLVQVLVPLLVPVLVPLLVPVHSETDGSGRYTRSSTTGRNIKSTLLMRL